MSKRRFLAAVGIALAVTISPVTRDTEAALGMGLSTAACLGDDCGYWNPFVDCFCPDLMRPQYVPICDDAVAP